MRISDAWRCVGIFGYEGKVQREGTKVQRCEGAKVRSLVSCSHLYSGFGTAGIHMLIGTVRSVRACVHVLDL